MTAETQAPDPGSVRATGLPADAEPMRSRPERFKPNDGGTWIDDDDFGFDAMLKVDGDFGSDADRLAYAQFICDKLNAPEAIPAPEGAQGDEREECVSWLSGLYPDAWPRQDAEHAWDHGHVFSLAWKERGRRAALAAPAPQAVPELTKAQVDAIWESPTPQGTGKSRYDLARELIAAARSAPQAPACAHAPEPELAESLLLLSLGVAYDGRTLNDGRFAFPNKDRFLTAANAIFEAGAASAVATKLAIADYIAAHTAPTGAEKSIPSQDTHK